MSKMIDFIYSLTARVVGSGRLQYSFDTFVNKINVTWLVEYHLIWTPNKLLIHFELNLNEI